MRKPTIYFTLLVLIVSSCSRPLVEVFDNYYRNSQQLDSLSNYFHKIKPDSIDIWIRFKEENTFDIVLWNKKTNTSGNEIFDKYGSYKKYGNPINDTLAIKVLDFISIDLNQLKRLKAKLNNVNCYSIGYKCDFWDFKNEGGFTEIGYPTNDFYGLTYILMDSTKNSIFLEKVNKKCNYKVINNKILLRYGGPAWGSDCFPDKK